MGRSGRHGMGLRAGKLRDNDMVAEARHGEIEEYHTHEVYTNTDAEECMPDTGQRPTTVR